MKRKKDNEQERKKGKDEKEQEKGRKTKRQKLNGRKHFLRLKRAYRSDLSAQHVKAKAGKTSVLFICPLCFYAPPQRDHTRNPASPCNFLFLFFIFYFPHPCILSLNVITLQHERQKRI